MPERSQRSKGRRNFVRTLASVATAGIATTQVSKGQTQSKGADEGAEVSAAPSSSARLRNPFDGGSALDWFNAGWKNTARIASLPGRSGTGLRVDCPAGENLGTQLMYNFDRGAPGYEPDEMWAQYSVRFGPWEMTDRRYEEGKLPGFMTHNGCGMGGGKCTGDEGFSARMGFAGGSGDDIQLTSYVYHADRQRGNYEWDRNGAGVVQKNQWYQITQHVTLNTPGEEDGKIRGWVDGMLAFDRTFQFRNAGAEFGIREWFHNVWWGGGSSDPSPQDNVVYFDDLRLGTGSPPL